MGLDYSFVLLIKRSDEQQLLTHISENGSIEQLAEPFGTCVTLNFLLDEVLVDYLNKIVRDRYGDAWTRRLLFNEESNYPEYFPTHNTGRIGCIYLDIKQVSSSDYSFVSFTAAASGMSRLFQTSPSIKNWFVHLSSMLNARAAFLDLEEQGYHFFYREGCMITAILNEDLEIVQATDSDRQAVTDICHDYAKLFLV
ncbi:hypothetical protein [Hymenobacter defluvii]|uniref:Uncharacterized protein n=1 Tax=Hymenobacter defluvii TaxID=2054411 RepID=A0ABS3TI56_9BACT|nr:hypothetical protein [Hymenobacter defluvii]MBO3273350.1 hypothetical protein [Hymenobacter defluvii]